MFRSFDDISIDIGNELKLTAKNIYKYGMIFQGVLLILGFISGIILAISEESAILLLIIWGSVVVEFLLALCIIYLISSLLFARGENIHLLRRIEGNTHSTPEAIASPAQPKAPPVQPVVSTDAKPQTTPAAQSTTPAATPAAKAANAPAQSVKSAVPPRSNTPISTLGVPQKVVGVPAGTDEIADVLEFALKYSSEDGSRRYLASVLSHTTDAPKKERLANILATPDGQLHSRIEELLQKK